MLLVDIVRSGGTVYHGNASTKKTTNIKFCTDEEVIRIGMVDHPGTQSTMSVWWWGSCDDYSQVSEKYVSIYET